MHIHGFKIHIVILCSQTVSEVVMKFVFKSTAPYRITTFTGICRIAALKLN